MNLKLYTIRGFLFEKMGICDQTIGCQKQFKRIIGFKYMIVVEEKNQLELPNISINQQIHDFKT